MRLQVILNFLFLKKDYLGFLLKYLLTLWGWAIKPVWPWVNNFPLQSVAKRGLIMIIKATQYYIRMHLSHLTQSLRHNKHQKQSLVVVIIKKQG